MSELNSRLIFCDGNLKYRGLVCPDDPSRGQVCTPTACYPVSITLVPDWSAVTRCPCNNNSWQSDSDFSLGLWQHCVDLDQSAPPGEQGLCGANPDIQPCHVYAPITNCLPVECNFEEIRNSDNTVEVPCSSDAGNPPKCCWEPGRFGLSYESCANWNPIDPCWRDGEPSGFANPLNATYGIAYLSAVPDPLFREKFNLPDEPRTIITGLFEVWQTARPWIGDVGDVPTPLNCCGGCEGRVARCGPGPREKRPLGYTLTNAEACCCAKALDCCGGPPPWTRNCCNDASGIEDLRDCCFWHAWENCLIDNDCYRGIGGPAGLSRCYKAWPEKTYAFLIYYPEVLPDLTPESILNEIYIPDIVVYFLAVKIQYNSATGSIEILGPDTSNRGVFQPRDPIDPDDTRPLRCTNTIVPLPCPWCIDCNPAGTSCDNRLCCHPGGTILLGGFNQGCCLIQSFVPGLGPELCGCGSEYQQSYRLKYVLTIDNPSPPPLFKKTKTAKFRHSGAGVDCGGDCPPIRYNCGRTIETEVEIATLKIIRP